mgnify:CR=1 FL=1
MKMNILKHMHLMQDNKVYPKTIEEMGNLVEDITYTGEDRGVRKANAGPFNRPFNRANKEQKKLYDKVLQKISSDFKENWPKMNDKEKSVLKDWLLWIAETVNESIEIHEHFKEQKEKRL